MKRLTLVTAAFAAGLTAFAPAAQSQTEEAEARPRTLVDFLRANAAGRQDRQDVDETVTASVATARPEAAPRRSAYDEIIARHAASHGVPVALAHAVVRVESNYRANARGRAGEIGLMQIKPATARSMGYSGGAQGLYDPETNIRYGMKYLGKARQLGGGDTCGTLLRYNAGHGAKRMNRISAAYCAKVKRHMPEA